MNAKTLLLVVPVIIIPLVGFVSWGLLRAHHPGFSHLQPGAHGFNMILPKALLPDAKHKDKLDTYRQAEQDSARYPAVMDPMPKSDSNANEQKVYRSIARLQEVLRTPHQPERLPSASTIPAHLGMAAPAQAPLQAIQPPAPLSTVPDPEMGQLSGILDKILYIQHPEAFHQETTEAGASMSEATLIDSGQTIEAVMVSDQSLVSGQTVSLRLLTDVRTKRGILPRNTEVTGLTSLEGERLHIRVRNVLYQNTFYPLGLEAYDLDGQQGLYIPGSLTRDVARQSADQALGAVSMGILDPSVGAQATNAGLQGLKTLLSRKVKEVRVTIRAGYRLILR